MHSSWSDEDANATIQNYAQYGEDLALRVYTTRLLGRDPALVLHGGGNTSVKTSWTDLLGRSQEVLCVKGSGWDMGEIEPAGLPAVVLEPLREMVALERMSDEEMVNLCRRNLCDSLAPNPSVEALLHAFLPHKFIDHTHADAVLAVANQPDATAVCRAIWGETMAYVPYVMPGFQLARQALAAYQAAPHVEGLILINHGIFTFGASARQAYERMIAAVDAAERYLANQATAPLPPRQLPTCEPSTVGECLTILRGCLNRHPQAQGKVVLETRRSAAIEAFLARPDLADLSARGPITPDHIIRTKQRPMILEPLADAAAFRQQVERELAKFVDNYTAYFQRQTQGRGLIRKMLCPLPVVFLIPGLGLVTAGATQSAARIAADIYEHTMTALAAAESVGRYQPLPEQDLFDMEYWSLEQAKLGKAKARDLEGHVTLVSGACGGIGAATAAAFARRGSNLILTDLDQPAVIALATRLSAAHKIAALGIAADLTQADQAEAIVSQAVQRFGGLDILVSNAGVAPTGPIHQASAALERSLRINLLAHQYLAAAAVSRMLSAGEGGCLLFNASKSAFNPGPGFGAYSVPKAALIALMKQYAVEFAAQGIRANAVNPDRIRTGLFDQDLLAARAAARGLSPDAYFTANLLGVEVRAEDVAEAFVHLQASAATTGCVLAVDGGNIAAAPR